MYTKACYYTFISPRFSQSIYEPHHQFIPRAHASTLSPLFHVIYQCLDYMFSRSSADTCDVSFLFESLLILVYLFSLLMWSFLCSYQYRKSDSIAVICLHVALCLFSDTLEKRIININEYFTFSLYSNVCRSLFEKHKLMFAFLLCARIMMNQNQINMVKN